MRIAVTHDSIDRINADTLILNLFESPEALEGRPAEMDQMLKGLVRTLLTEQGPAGRSGKTVVVHPVGTSPLKRVVLAGLGKSKDLDADRCRRACGKAAAQAQEQGAERVAVMLPDQAVSMLSSIQAPQAAVEGVLLGTYRLKHHKTSSPETGPIREVFYCTSGQDESDAAEQGVRLGEIFADATLTARDLINQPGNFMTPRLLAEVAEAVAVQENLTLKVLEADAVEELGMGAFLGVARGSLEPLRFIVLEYAGSSKKADDQPLVALVGKGITFDSGGISLKPPARMEEMKNDMAGAAAVIAVLQGVARLKLPFRVVGLVPACENLPSGKALKPGDVLTAMNGKTIEVVNTDAEGRLILADALCYAMQYKPDAVIDLATLTGACITALGEEVAGGIFSNDDKLCSGLIDAGEVQGEKLWRLPLFGEYRKKIKSGVADMKNTGGRFGGVGTSARFLMEFTDYPWAHLDIAGMVLAKKDRPYIPKGATGFGVRTLLGFLMNYPGR